MNCCDKKPAVYGVGKQPIGYIDAFIMFVRETFRVGAWFLFYLGVTSMLGMVFNPLRIEEQMRVWMLGSLCMYGWWRLK